MVIEVLHSWEQLFRAIDSVRGDRIDAIRIRYRSELTDRMVSQRWPARSAIDLEQLREAFPAIYRGHKFSSFAIEVGDDEVVKESVAGCKDAVLRVMVVTAS